MQLKNALTFLVCTLAWQSEYKLTVFVFATSRATTWFKCPERAERRSRWAGYRNSSDRRPGTTWISRTHGTSGIKGGTWRINTRTTRTPWTSWSSGRTWPPSYRSPGEFKDHLSFKLLKGVSVNLLCRPEKKRSGTAIHRVNSVELFRGVRVNPPKSWIQDFGKLKMLSQVRNEPPPICKSCCKSTKWFLFGAALLVKL